MQMSLLYENKNQLQLKISHNSHFEVIKHI